MLKKVILLISLVLGFSFYSYGETIDDGLVFYACFDGNMKARTETGILRPDTRPAKSSFEKGVKGQALKIKNRYSLYYSLDVKCLPFAKGSASLWMKANYDNTSFREAADKLRKEVGWFWSHHFLKMGDLSKLKISISFGQDNYILGVSGFGFRVYTYPRIQHRKGIKLPFEQGKWIHFLYTWDVAENSLEFYIDGDRVSAEIKESEDATWNIPEKIEAKTSIIKICDQLAINYHGKNLTTEEQKEIRKEFEEELGVEDYTHSIDEVRIYNRVLEKKEIESLFEEITPNLL